MEGRECTRTESAEMNVLPILTLLAVFTDNPLPEIIQNDEPWVCQGYTAVSTEVSFRDYTDAEGDIVGMHVCFPDSLNGKYRILFCFRNSLLILVEGAERPESISLPINAQYAFFSPNGRYVFLHDGNDYTGSNGLRIDSFTGEQMIYDPQPNGGWGSPWTYPHNDGSVVTRKDNSLYVFNEELQCVLNYNNGNPLGVICSDNGDYILFSDGPFMIKALNGFGEHLWTIGNNELGSMYTGAGMNCDVSSNMHYAVVPLSESIVLLDLETGSILARYLEGMIGYSAMFSPDDQFITMTANADGEQVIARGFVAAAGSDENLATIERLHLHGLHVYCTTNNNYCLVSHHSFEQAVYFDQELQPVWVSGTLHSDQFPRVFGNSAMDGSGNRFAFMNANGYMITEICETELIPIAE
jgi:hypothetical protein